MGQDGFLEPPLERIKKLLAHAEASEYPQSETYRNKAMQLIAKWNVDEASLYGDEDIDWQHIEVYPLDGERYAFEFAHLLSSICNGLRSVRCLYASGTRTACLMIGPKEASERAVALFENLKADMLTRSGEFAVRGPQYVSNHMAAYSQAIEDRLLRMTQSQAPEGTGKDLVMVSNLTKIDQYIEEELAGDLNRVSPSYGRGYAQGAYDGMRADLGNSVEGLNG